MENNTVESGNIIEIDGADKVSMTDSSIKNHFETKD